MNKKILAIFFTMLMCLTTIIIPKNYIVSASSGGKTLFVGGHNFGNYSNIQDAINDATSGNTTIFVYDGSYCENLIVNKTINLTSESNETIIDGNREGTAVLITADWVNLTGFTIQNCGDQECSAGILVRTDNCNISGTIVKDCYANGILLENASHTMLNSNDFINISMSGILLWNTSFDNNISDNNFMQCGFGIEAGNGSYGNTIINNSFTNSSCGVFFRLNTSDNLIKENVFVDTIYGAMIEEATNNSIIENLFEQNEIGVRILGVNSPIKNNIFHNAFINNTLHCQDECDQTWDDGYPSAGNYWDDGNITDVYQGSSQNLSGSDGIADMPYFELGNFTIDRYPLTQLWGTYDPVPSFSTIVNVGLVSFNASTSYDRDGSIVNWTWFFGDTEVGYGEEANHTYTQDGAYPVTLLIIDNDGKNETLTCYLVVGTDNEPPQILDVSNNPETLGFGFDVTISANVTDNFAVNTVVANITIPNSTYMTAPMSLVSDNLYQYVFPDTWSNGLYNYTVRAMDYSDNTNISGIYNFTISSNASVSICTVHDAYGDNEPINLTDPPMEASQPIGYELLDDDTVIHIWNHFDSYYFNTSSGIQLTNHYDDYWSHNVMMLGYYNSNQWNLIYRADELSGFNKNIETDNVTFVNVTIWKDLTYNGYSFRLAIRYHLGIDDRELTVIPYIKNLGIAIPYTLGFAWEINDIQVAMTPENDYLEINGTRLPLNESVDVIYKQLSEPVFSINEDLLDGVTESLSLRWGESLNYLILVKSRDDEYNAPVILGIKIGSLSTGQEKYTELLWHDASQMTYYFNHHDRTDIWATNPDNMVDGNLSKYASTTIQNDVELCDTSTYNGTSLGTISKVELRVYGYCSNGHRDIILQPVFNGHDHGNNYSYSPSSTPTWSSWYDITNDPGRHIFGTWNWSEIQDLDCDVTSQYIQFGGAFNLLCSKIELRVTYNNAPVITNPVPPHGSDGIVLLPWLNITVADPNGDTMNLTWYSNSTARPLILRPNAAGNITELNKQPVFTPSNYMCVDEEVANDNDYVYRATTSWKKDTYNLPSHGASTGVIHDVTVYARCGYGGIGVFPGTPNAGKIVLKTDENYYYGDQFSLSGTYASFNHKWNTNPGTGAPWTWTEIDSLQAGVALIGDLGGASKCSQLYVVVNHTDQTVWTVFGTNSSVSDGVYRQPFMNATVNGQWWYWKVKADDGTLSTWSSVYKFYTGYQSKIWNTGETAIKGYLLIQVQFYNASSEVWEVDMNTVNETTPRTIAAEEQFGLDTIFNGQVNSWNLTHGNGTYRIYVAFRDANGIVLQVDGFSLNASYEFSVTMDYDSDDDGWTDYDELNQWYTNPLDDDTDDDGVIDPNDIDPLVDLKIQFTSKRIHASQYSYTWREGETWDESNTNTTGLGDNTDWILYQDPEASNGLLTRQNDSKEGIEDFASWRFTVNKGGFYYIWIRNHRNMSGAQNVNITWNDEIIFDKKNDDLGPGYEICWYQNITKEGVKNWTWSRYGALWMDEGIGWLNITNAPPERAPGANFNRPGDVDDWMEVDNILITDDPACNPESKGIEDSSKSTIGYDSEEYFDPDLSAPDFYLKITIGSTTRTSSPWWNTYDVLDDWSPTEVDVSDVKGNEEIPIQLKLYDEDGATDDQVDISPKPSSEPDNKVCSLQYNLENASWWGDDFTLDIDFKGRTCGEVDGAGQTDGDVIFNIHQSDYDSDGITYWQEILGPFHGSVNPKITNNRYGLIVGAGACCKLIQESNDGSSTWQPGRGLLYQGPHYTYDDGLNWNDYTFHVDVMTREIWPFINSTFENWPDFDEEQIGVMFRYQDENNYYLLRWQKRYLRDRISLDLVHNGDLTNLGDYYMPLIRRDWYSLNISVDQDHIYITVNNNNFKAWSTIFDLTDDTLSTGTIGIWSWKNQQALFDDILIEKQGVPLFTEDFDIGQMVNGWEKHNGGTWSITERLIDQEDFYVQPDFLYRLLLLTAHYNEHNILYLSADKWRDADGDSVNDAIVTTRSNLRSALSDWLKQSTYENNLALVYIFDHGYNDGMLDPVDEQTEKGSSFEIDNNRNGRMDLVMGAKHTTPFSGDPVYDITVKSWLPRYKAGRLTFIIEACYIGAFRKIGYHPFDKQNITTITSTTWNTSAGGRTGEDWPAFSNTLFMTMADGRTDFAHAFDIADQFVNETDFQSVWTIIDQNGINRKTDSRLDDNGNGQGSSYPLRDGEDGRIAGITGL